MIPTIVVFVYLAVVLYIGIFAFRKGTSSGEDYFVASRSLGNWVFLLSLFGTNMTAFAILGSSGLAYQRGIGVYGLMASAAGFVIPLTIFFIGTRLWAMGKKFGHITQVQYFRDRWECGHIGTLIFAVTAAMLVPYIIIGVMGGGQTLEALSTMMGPDGKPQLFEVVRNGQTLMEPRHWISYEVGGGKDDEVAVLVASIDFTVGNERGAPHVGLHVVRPVDLARLGIEAVQEAGEVAHEQQTGLGVNAHRRNTAMDAAILPKLRCLGHVAGLGGVNAREDADAFAMFWILSYCHVDTVIVEHRGGIDFAPPFRRGILDGIALLVLLEVGWIAIELPDRF